MPANLRRYNRDGGVPGSPTTNSLGDGGLGLRPNVRELSPRREDGGTNQGRVVPQRGSYSGLPMSPPGNAGRSNVPDIFEDKKTSRLPKKLPVTRPQYREDIKPPPGLEGLPPAMMNKAWTTFLDPKIKGLGVFDPAVDVGIKRDQADIASLKTAEDEAPFAPRVRPQLRPTGDIDITPPGGGLSGMIGATQAGAGFTPAPSWQEYFDDADNMSILPNRNIDGQPLYRNEGIFFTKPDYEEWSANPGQGTFANWLEQTGRTARYAPSVPSNYTGGTGLPVTPTTPTTPKIPYDPRATGNAMFGVRSQQDILELQNEIYNLLRDPSNIVDAPGVPEGYEANLQTNIADFISNFDKESLRGNLSEQELSDLLTSTVTERLGGQGLGLSEEALQNQYATQFSDLARMQRQQEERIVQQSNVGRRLGSMGTLGEIARNTIPFDEQRRDIISNVIAEDQRRQQAEMNARVAQAQGLTGTQYAQQLQAEQLQADLDKYGSQFGLQKAQFLSGEDQRRLGALRDQFGMGMDVADFDYRQKQQNLQNLMGNLGAERQWYGQDRNFDLALAQAEAMQGNAMDPIFSQLMSQGGMSDAFRQLQSSYEMQRGDNETFGDWISELIGNWNTGTQGGQV